MRVRYDRVTSAVIHLLFTAILYSKDLTEMSIESDNILELGPVTF